MLKKLNRKPSVFAIILMTVILLAIPVEAVLVPFHSPAVTLITENAPRDLEMTMVLQHSKYTVEVNLPKKTVAWEQQFRLFREGVYTITNWYGNRVDLKGAKIIMTSGGESKTVELSQELTDRMSEGVNDILIYDYKHGTFHLGDPFWRGPLMMILRLLVAVGLELLIFRLRGFVYGSTYLWVSVVGLFTFGHLVYFTRSWLNMDNRSVVPYIVFFFLVMVAQIVAFVLLVEEERQDRITETTVMSCFAGVISNVLMLTLLPV